MDRGKSKLDGSVRAFSEIKDGIEFNEDLFQAHFLFFGAAE